MTDTTEPTPFIPATEKGTAEAVFQSIAELLHSDNIEVMNILIPLNSTDAIQSQIVIGEPSENDGHVLVSTYGLGGVETEAKANIDGEETGLRVELFTIAKNVEEAKVLAEELAAVSYEVYKSKTPLVPGVIFGKPDSTHYAISTSPYGIHENHGHNPVQNPKYIVSFFAVNRITEKEAQLLSQPEGAPEFFDYYTGLGVEAYALDRPEFSKE